MFLDLAGAHPAAAAFAELACGSIMAMYTVRAGAPAPAFSQPLRQLLWVI